jgi:hypothetical protein
MNAIRKIGFACASFAALAGVVHAQLPDACKGRYNVQNRTVHTCHYTQCNNRASLGYTYSQTCTTWCCPDGSAEYDPSTCVGTYNTGDCCKAGSGAYTPGFLCNRPGK